jgi:HNH endonuclease
VQLVTRLLGLFYTGPFEDARMSSKKIRSDIDSQDRIIAEARQNQLQREKTYRAQALKMYPWICARCGREFSGKKLRELTVHHKDHNHDNNPPDGSNWELLCLYCHDNEHARHLVAEAYDEVTPGGEQEPPSTYRPFADLADLLKRKT